MPRCRYCRNLLLEDYVCGNRICQTINQQEKALILNHKYYYDQDPEYYKRRLQEAMNLKYPIPKKNQDISKIIQNDIVPQINERG